MHQSMWHLDIKCKSYEVRVNIFWIDVVKPFQSLTGVHMDFGDVNKVMMVVSGMVQFWMLNPPSEP